MDNNEPQRVEAFGDTERDWLGELANEHLWNERAHKSLDRRLRAVERKHVFLPEDNQERMMIYLAGAYVLFAFVIPTVMDLFRERRLQP